MTYRAIKFKSQPSIVYVLEHSELFGIDDELMITSLLRAAGMVDSIMFAQNPRDNMVAVKAYWPEAEQLFFFTRASVLAWECQTDGCGRTLPRCGGSARDKVFCPCGAQMTGTARIHGLPWLS